MTEKPVAFRSEGMRIAGMLHLPVQKMRSPCVVLCHGFASDKSEDHWMFVRLARALRDEGFAVLRFDARYCNDSEGEFEHFTVTGYIRDLEGTLRFVKRLGRVDPARVYVLGQSLGSCVAICTASRDPSIRGVASWSGAASLRELFHSQGVKRYFKKVGRRTYLYTHHTAVKIGQGFFEDAINYSPEDIVGKISPRPLLILHGTGDELVPVEHARRLYRASRKPKSLRLVRGADHSFMEPRHLERAIAKTIKWLKHS